MDTNQTGTNGKQNVPLNDTIITITGINPIGNELYIQGGATTKTKPGKKVTWVVDTSDVSEIYLILPDYDPSAIFEDKVKKPSGSAEWTGKIKTTGLPPLPFEEKYTIIYKKAATGDKLYIYDPIIQVNT